MTLEVGLWRADKHGLTRLSPSRVALESKLEEYIENDPTILGQPLLLIGRQVPTAHGGFIDLLAVDAEGVVHVLELKRDRTPRDVVAQTLDYGSRVAELSHAHIVELFEAYQPGIAFDEAFARHFGGEPPEELNAAQVFTVVAASVDPATERIVRFLNETFNVPINVVFFRHFEERNLLSGAHVAGLRRGSTARPEQRGAACAGTVERTRLVRVVRCRRRWSFVGRRVSMGSSLLEAVCGIPRSSRTSDRRARLHLHSSGWIRRNRDRDRRGCTVRSGNSHRRESGAEARRTRAHRALPAADCLELTAAQIERLGNLTPASGERNEEADMAAIDR